MHEHNLTMKQRVEQFDLKQGGRELAVLDGSMLLYPNGARRDINPLGCLEDPPEYNASRALPHESENSVTFELLQRRLRYHAMKVALAVKAFNTHRNSMANTDYTDEAYDELERLQADVQAARDEQKLVEAERAEHPIAASRAFSQQHDATMKARIAEKNARLKAMRV